MVFLYHEIFYRPLLNLLVFFYQTIAGHDLGLAIIFATILVRLILYPFFHKGAKQQMLMQRIQPHVKKIQEKHKDNREEQAKALMELYKEHGVSPFSGILLLIIQLPILITLYSIFRGGIGPTEFASLYHFVSAPQSINATLLGLIDLNARSLPLIIAAGTAQFFQARLAIYRDPNSTAPPTAAEKLGRQMAFIGPAVTVAIFYSLPAAVGLYWFVTSAFSAFQQLFVNRHLREKYGE